MAYDAESSEYAGIINTVVSELDNTPGGAPPGAIIESIYVAQQGENSVFGDTMPHGIMMMALDHPDVTAYVAKYDSEPNLYDTTEAVRVVSEGVDRRYDEGGIYKQWDYAALGFTGYVDKDGVKPNLTEEESRRGAGWFEDFTNAAIMNKNVGTKLRDMTGVADPGTMVPKITDGMLVSKEVETPIHEQVISPMGGVIDAIKQWAPRVLLFIIGIVFLGFGLKVVFT